MKLFTKLMQWLHSVGSKGNGLLKSLVNSRKIVFSVTERGGGIKVLTLHQGPLETELVSKISAPSYSSMSE